MDNGKAGPPIILRVGDSVTRIEGSQRRNLCIALLEYVERQEQRIAAAVSAGNLGHADARAKDRRQIEDLIEFIEEAGVPLPAIWRRNNAPLPSEVAKADDRPLDIARLVEEQLG